MKTYLHFFNYDLIRKIRDAETPTAPKGYYGLVATSNITDTEETGGELHMYYKGEDLEEKSPRKETYYEEFILTDDMILFEY